MPFHWVKLAHNVHTSIYIYIYVNGKQLSTPVPLVAHGGDCDLCPAWGFKLLWHTIVFASQCDETKRNLDVRTLLSQVKNAPVNEDFARGQTEAFAPPLGIKGKLNRRCKLAWNIKSAQIFLFACSVNIYSNGLFCFTFELLRAQPCWLACYQKEQRKIGWWRIWRFCHTYWPGLLHH